MRPRVPRLALLFGLACLSSSAPADEALHAGAAKVLVTHPDAKPGDGPLYAKALVLKQADTTAVLITVDAVAIGELGTISNDYLPRVRRRLQQALQVEPSRVFVNASHCHGRLCPDIEDKTVQVVEAAMRRLAEVRVGVAAGSEDRISENRRLRLKDGRQADVRRAYSLPPDDTVAAVGPIDPQVGVLRIDRLDGRPLAVVYNFACHPIEGIPSGGSTADLVGFASQTIEDCLSHDAVALFVQGCAGDVNPVLYKDVHRPRDAEPLGLRLGLGALSAWRSIEPRPSAALRVHSDALALPRADHAPRIARLEAEQTRLVQSLRPTNLDLKTFLPLVAQYRLADAMPANAAATYLYDQVSGRDAWSKLDAQNRQDIEQYLRNIRVMEELTRLQTNLAQLRRHQQRNQAAGSATIAAEVGGLRVGDFRLVTFPGELSVEIGLGIKRRAGGASTFVAGYTNGYIYYAPTAEQARNPGYAQEDCDCLLAPEWQQQFESHVTALLKRL